MPGFVVDELDKRFPNEDRSRVITRATIEYMKKAKAEHSFEDLGGILSDEDADQMLSAIEEMKKIPSRKMLSL